MNKRSAALLATVLIVVAAVISAWSLFDIFTNNEEFLHVQEQKTLLISNSTHFVGRTWQTVYPTNTQHMINEGIYTELTYINTNPEDFSVPEITHWNYSCILSLSVIDENGVNIINSSEPVTITGGDLPFGILYTSGITLTMPSSGNYHVISELQNITLTLNIEWGEKPIILTSQNATNVCDKYVQVLK